MAEVGYLGHLGTVVPDRCVIKSRTIQILIYIYCCRGIDYCSYVDHYFLFLCITN